jgi:hypothetical protein
LQCARHIYRRLGRNHCLAELRSIVSEADAEYPFHGVRCSVGLQLPLVRVPGRLRRLIVEIANLCSFFPDMIGIGSFHETGNPGFSAKIRRT